VVVVVSPADHASGADHAAADRPGGEPVVFYEPGQPNQIRTAATGPTAVHWSSTATTGTHHAICPDLLRLSALGEADGWRGHVVRAFFRLLKVVSGL
jgi:hypothetical protein